MATVPDFLVQSKRSSVAYSYERLNDPQLKIEWLIFRR